VTAKKLMWSLIYKKRCCGYELLKVKNYFVETTKSFFIYIFTVLSESNKK
jgi:hypothetical protein